MTQAILHHVHQLCKNKEAMVSFWQNSFGLEIMGTGVVGGCPGTYMALGNGLRLTIQEVANDLAPQVRCGGFDHIGFQVDDFDASLARLLALPDVTLHKSEAKSDVYRYAFIKGPEGIVVEILSPLE